MHEGKGALSALVVMAVAQEKETKKHGLCASRGTQSIGAPYSESKIICMQVRRRLRVTRKYSRGRPLAPLTALIGCGLSGERPECQSDRSKAIDSENRDVRRRRLDVFFCELL